jgi:hypothetical protein
MVPKPLLAKEQQVQVFTGVERTPGGVNSPVPFKKISR